MNDLRTLNKYRDEEWQKACIPEGTRRSLAGAFVIKLKSGVELSVIADNGIRSPEWEHVSVSLKERCPTWEEMCQIKDLFFREDEAVIQIHPAKEEYVNIHKNCLHLWRPKNQKLPLPEKRLVT